MRRNLSTLYELCSGRIAQMLKSSHWNSELPLSRNPFRLLPSAVIDTLIIYVTRKSISVPLESSDLRLLLTTGRVRRFELEDVTTEFEQSIVKVSAENLRRILVDLSSSSKYLISVTINLEILKEQELPTVTGALNCLLAETRNLKHVESCVEFDLHLLYSAICLQNLVLYGPVKNRLCDFLEFNGELRPQTSLKHIELSEDLKWQISYVDIAVILKYCTELISINCDISESLEHLHAKELKNGSLTQKYKMKKCEFGNCFDYASRDGINIASLTCPDLHDITIYLHNKERFSALHNFPNLADLEIFFDLRYPVIDRDYALGLRSLLQKTEIGHNLKSLSVNDISNVDFALIGMCCPNLEILDMFYEFANNRSEFLPTSFRKLHSLFLVKARESDVEADTLRGILTNAVNLTCLSIEFSGELSDDLLKEILTNNSLSILKRTFLPHIGLSLSGVKNLASSVTALEYFGMYDSFCLDINDVAAIFREVNPRVFVEQCHW